MAIIGPTLGSKPLIQAPWISQFWLRGFMDILTMQFSFFSKFVRVEKNFFSKAGLFSF